MCSLSLTSAVSLGRDVVVVQLPSHVHDPMDCSPPGFPVPQHLPEFVQVHVLVLQTEGRRRRGWQGDEMIGWHH